MNVIWILLITSVVGGVLAKDEETPLFPPPESPLDCHFESDFCGWRPAGTDYFQWQRRGYIGNTTKNLYSPTEGYLSCNLFFKIKLKF